MLYTVDAVCFGSSQSVFCQICVVVNFRTTHNEPASYNIQMEGALTWTFFPLTPLPPQQKKSTSKLPTKMPMTTGDGLTSSKRTSLKAFPKVWALQQRKRSADWGRLPLADERYGSSRASSGCGGEPVLIAEATHSRVVNKRLLDMQMQQQSLS
jgi:hypothetical protein